MKDNLTPTPICIRIGLFSDFENWTAWVVNWFTVYGKLFCGSLLFCVNLRGKLLWLSSNICDSQSQLYAAASHAMSIH